MEVKTYRELLEEYNYDKIEEMNKEINDEFNLPRRNLSKNEQRKIQQRRKEIRNEQLEERFVSVHQIVRWIDNLRKSNYMWRYPVDECFGMLEDAITSDSEPNGSTHNKDLTENQK